MAKLKFGAWIPTYAWSGGKSDPRNVKRIRAAIEKCEDHGIDVWVIDHLLSAPGLYGNAWLEPLNALAFAAALTRKVKIAAGIPVFAVPPPRPPRQADFPACPPLRQPLHLRRRAGLVRARVRGHRLAHRGARPA